MIFQEEQQKMKTLEQYKAEQMKNDDFAKAYEDVQSELNEIRTIVEAGASQNMTP